jgi:hypothetical protein
MLAIFVGVLSLIYTPQESPRLIEITVESRVIKKIGERGGRMVIFLLRPNLFFGPLSLFWGTKNKNV